MITLISAAQDFTASFVDLGSPVKTGNNKYIGLWLNIDINSTLNPRVRALAQLDAAGGTAAEYFLPIKTVSATAVNIQEEYIEYDDDVDQQVILGVELNGIVPYVQFQIQAGTVGATAGQIDNAYVTRDNFN